jgi:hypothetical protein
MSDHLNHAEEANRVITTMLGGDTLTEAYAYAQIHATLALVEQQQIANLVEMAQSPLFHAFDGSNPALDALMEKTGGVAPDIAAALGIEGSDE